MVNAIHTNDSNITPLTSADLMIRFIDLAPDTESYTSLLVCVIVTPMADLSELREL